MSKDLKKLSDEELLNIALDYADDTPSFDSRFVKGLEKSLKEYHDLTADQRFGLENVVKKFRMV